MLDTLELFLTAKHDCLTDEAFLGGNGFRNVRRKCEKNVSSAGNKGKHLSRLMVVKIMCSMFTPKGQLLHTIHNPQYKRQKNSLIFSDLFDEGTAKHLFFFFFSLLFSSFFIFFN